jgi:hypothetical protein
MGEDEDPRQIFVLRPSSLVSSTIHQDSFVRKGGGETASVVCSFTIVSEQELIPGNQFLSKHM